MSNVRQLTENGVPIYPITERSLVIGLQDAPFEYYVPAWDGESTPVVANIPAGVVVTYNNVNYTGTLAASATTAPYLYLVASTTQVGEYDRYIVTNNGNNTFTWTHIGSTAAVTPAIADNLTTNDPTKALSAKQGKVLGDNLGQLEAEVDDLQDELVLDVSGDVNLGKWEVGSIGYYGGAIINSASTSRVRMAQKTITKEGDYKLTCASGFEFAILIVGKVTTVTWVTSFERHLVVGDVYRIAMRQSPLGDYTGYTQAQIDTLVASSQISFKTYGLATKPEVDAKLDKETFDLKFSYPQNLTATIQGFVGNNGLIYNNSGYWRTDYISLHGYDRIFARAIIYNNGCDIAFFDENKTFIPGISVVGTGGTHTYEIDLTGVSYQNARYVVISTINQDWNLLKLFSYDSLSNDMMLMPANNHINMLVFGDSITHAANIYLDENNCTSTYAWDTGATAKPWVQIVRDYLQAYDVRDYAKHGATYVDLGAELLSVSFQIQVAINDLSNPNNVFPTQGTFHPDIVIFALGTNDGSPADTYEEAMAKTIFDQDGNVDVEATLNNLDRTKLYQSLRYAYLRAKYTWPYAMMMVVLPIQRAGTPNNFVVGTLHDAIKRMANRHSIKVIDGAFDMGVCTDLEKISAEGALLFDGLHPNAKGKNVYARMMLNAIKSNYVNLSNMNPIS